MPRTFLATLQFDGTDYIGWQRQRAGRAVQTVVETVLERLAGQPVRVHAAGRTDAGVHALGMGASFALPDGWTPVALQRALDGLLPPDCRAVDVREARTGFHARRAATGRRYRYRIGTDRGAASPFRRRYEWPLGRALDPDRLAAAAARIRGVHDFQALSVKRSWRPHTRCEIREAAWSPRLDAAGFDFEVSADRFLHHMVRMLVGTMVDIALERRPPDDLDRLLRLDPAVRTSPPAPAGGLYFVTAEYPDEWFELTRDS